MNDGTKDPDPLAPADAEETHAANALREALEGRPGGVEAPESALLGAALLRAGGPAARLSDARHAALRTELLASLPKEGGAPRTARAGLPRWFLLFLPLAGGAAAVLAFGVFAARSSDPLAALDDAIQIQSVVSANPGGGSAASAAATSAQDNVDSLSEPSVADGREALRGGSAHPVRALAAEQGSGAFTRPVANKAAPVEARARAAAAPSAGAGSLAPADTGERFANGAPKASQPPFEERLRRETQRYRSALLPRLADGRVAAAYTDLDRAQSGDQLRAAQTELTALSAGTLGSGVDAADTDRVRQDIFCRLAEVALRLGQPQSALDWTRRGLEIEALPNPFAARLHQLAGQAHEVLGDRESAARSYAQAIDVNEKLLDESLDAP